MDLSSLGRTIGDTHTADVAAEDSIVRPDLVYQSAGAAVYRRGGTGIKVLVDSNPGEDQVLRLVHEDRVSRLLPDRCRCRHTLDVRGFRGDPAVYFVWAGGRDLAEWLRDARVAERAQWPGSNRVVKTRLTAAIAIAKTLVQFHDNGVVYNNLSPSNIVLDEVDGSCVATFIDLSEALVSLQNDEEFARQVREIDLKSLGVILYEMFCNNAVSGDTDDEEEEKEEREDESTGESTREGGGDVEQDPDGQRKRGRQQPGGAEDDLPMYLGVLISTLLLCGKDDATNLSQAHYETASDVLRDLTSAERCPELYIPPPVLDDSLAHGRLELPISPFWGRQAEVSTLVHALNSVTKSGGQSMMVSISGGPGMGKTSLVHQIEKPLRDVGGFMVCGKFDARARSDSVIFSALNQFYLDVMKEGMGGTAKDMRSRVLQNVGAGCKVLGKCIPSLRTFLGDDFHVSINDAPDAPSVSEHRWKYLLCKLIAASSSETHPLVYFLDDLQWADEVSLDVMRMIVTDPDIKYILFCLVHRNNEMTSAARLERIILRMQEQGVSLMSIRIGPIEKDLVKTILSETLLLPPTLCQPLSTTIHSKTGGVTLFVMNFLKSLNEEGLLWFNLTSRRWEFDTRRIELKEISADVVEHLSKQMTRLPNGVKQGLKLSACLGSKFDAMMLQKGSPKGFDVVDFLQFAVEMGYLRELPSDKYVWAHDQVLAAAYQMIPDRKKESFHLLLGSRIFVSTSQLDADLFTIVENINIGICLINSKEQKLEVAGLNLKAGHLAIASSSFNSAQKYLMTGISLLPDNSWAEEYELTLRLFEAASEANYVIGDFETLSSIIQIPLLHASCFEDKISTYKVLVRSLVSWGKLGEAISTSRKVLAQLGEALPEQVENNIYETEVEHVRQSHSDLSDNDLLGLPLMTDQRKLTCIEFLNLAFAPAHRLQSLLAPFHQLRMFRLTLEHGICNLSAIAFALYGCWLVSSEVSDFDGGHRMGRLAIGIMDRLEAKEFTSQVYAAVYGLINFWKEPFQANMEKLLEGYDAGLLSGDSQYALVCLYAHALGALYTCGEDLGLLEKNIRLYVRRAIHCNHYFLAKALVVLHELCLTLVNSKESSYAIFFNSREDALYEEWLKNSDINPCRCILQKRKFLAYLNENMGAAAQLLEMGLQFPTGANVRMSNITISTFLDGLIAFYFVRTETEDKSRWQKTGETVIDLTRKWAASSNWNFINKLYLLEAEQCFSDNNEPQAIEKYKESIKAAREHRFVHEEGLAHQREARFHLHYRRNDQALVCFLQAKKCYETWGASSVVNHIESTITALRGQT